MPWAQWRSSTPNSREVSISHVRDVRAYWCTDVSGERGCERENWVEIRGDSCVPKRDYDATELSVGVGAALTLEFEESGCAWATTVIGEGVKWIG